MKVNTSLRERSVFFWDDVGFNCENLFFTGV